MLQLLMRTTLLIVFGNINLYQPETSTSKSALYI